MKQTLGSYKSFIFDFSKRLIFSLSMTALFAVAAGYFDPPKNNEISQNELHEVTSQVMDTTLR